MYSYLYILLAAIPTNDAKQNVPGVHEIARKVLDERNSIRSGIVSLQVKTNVELRQPVAEKVVVDYTVYFRGNAIRRDELRHLPNGQIAKYWSVYAFGRCLRSYNDDDYIILNAAAGRNYNDLGISSPLVFGLTEKPSVSVAVKPDIVAGAWPERATSVVVKEILEGVETWRVTTTYESRRGTYWVAPGMKFSIVKYAAYWDDQVQTELLCKPKTYANGDVYFPEEVRLSSVWGPRKVGCRRSNIGSRREVQC